MKFPKMNKRPRAAVEIPDLSGGLNMRDGAQRVGNHQLTECKNMWFSDGLLKTRPALVTDDSHNTPLGRAVSDTRYSGSRRFENIKYSKDGNRYILHSVSRNAYLLDKDGNYIEQTLINPVWIGQGGNIKLSGLSVSGRNATYFFALHQTVLYCFTSTREIYRLSKLDGSGSWERLSDEDIYLPTVASGLGVTRVIDGRNETALQNAILGEGANILGRRIRLLYSTVDLGYLAETGQTSHEMRYTVPFAGDARALIPEVLRVNITYPSGVTVTHTATSGADPLYYESALNSGDSLKLEVYCNGDIAELVFVDKSGNIKNINEADFLYQNMEVIAPFNNKHYDRVFSMTRAEWFSGAAAGLAGGNRLFLGANTVEGERNIVVWSDLNRPLYFSENCYFYVGDGMSAVTGFGRQSDMLVIFKENETYFTRYEQTKNIPDYTVDLAAASALFPLTLINSGVGCDLPDTVQLCRNRLVWTNSNGRVYTLTSGNQYSERNIFAVGGMVEQGLFGEDLSSASACDWRGHYVLLTGKSAYLMDYNSSGYQNVASYVKGEDASLRIPWYRWEFAPSIEGEPFYDPKISAVDESLILYGFFDARNAENVGIISFFLDLGALEDISVFEAVYSLGYTKTPVSCLFAGRLFDFKAADLRKNIEGIALSLGANGGAPMRVTLITDCGEKTVEIALERSKDGIENILISPDIRAVLRFGIRMECDGFMSIAGATVYYRLLGPAR